MSTRPLSITAPMLLLFLATSSCGGDDKGDGPVRISDLRDLESNGANPSSPAPSSRAVEASGEQSHGSRAVETDTPPKPRSASVPKASGRKLTPSLIDSLYESAPLPWAIQPSPRVDGWATNLMAHHPAGATAFRATSGDLDSIPDGAKLTHIDGSKPADGHFDFLDQIYAGSAQGKDLRLGFKSDGGKKFEVTLRISRKWQDWTTEKLRKVHTPEAHSIASEPLKYIDARLHDAIRDAQDGKARAAATKLQVHEYAPELAASADLAIARAALQLARMGQYFERIGYKESEFDQQNSFGKWAEHVKTAIELDRAKAGVALSVTWSVIRGRLSRIASHYNGSTGYSIVWETLKLLAPKEEAVAALISSEIRQMAAKRFQIGDGLMGFHLAYGIDVVATQHSQGKNHLWAQADAITAETVSLLRRGKVKQAAKMFNSSNVRSWSLKVHGNQADFRSAQMGRLHTEWINPASHSQNHLMSGEGKGLWPFVKPNYPWLREAIEHGIAEWALGNTQASKPATAPSLMVTKRAKGKALQLRYKQTTVPKFLFVKSERTLQEQKSYGLTTRHKTTEYYTVAGIADAKGVIRTALVLSEPTIENCWDSELKGLIMKRITKLRNVGARRDELLPHGLRSRTTSFGQVLTDQILLGTWCVPFPSKPIAVGSTWTVEEAGKKISITLTGMDGKKPRVAIKCDRIQAQATINPELPYPEKYTCRSGLTTVKAECFPSRYR